MLLGRLEIFTLLVVLSADVLAKMMQPNTPFRAAASRASSPCAYFPEYC